MSWMRNPSAKPRICPRKRSLKPNLCYPRYVIVTCSFYSTDKVILIRLTGLAKRVAHSDQVQTAFMDCCEHVDLKPLMLKRPVATRWNTHFACLDRHLLQKAAVERLCDHASYSKFKLDKYTLSDVEWDILDQLKPVLEVSFISYIFLIVIILMSLLAVRPRNETYLADANRPRPSSHPDR